MPGTQSPVCDSVSVTAYRKSEHLTRQLWQGLHGDASALTHLRFDGSGSISCPFPVMDLAAASFAVAGLAVSELLRTAGIAHPAVSVDRRLATTWFDVPFAPSRFLDVADPHGIHQRWMAEFQTADDRWIRVQAMYPSLRARMLRALGLPPDAAPDDVAPAVRALTADEAESRLVQAGAAAAVARTMSEWNSHPQGRAVAQEPIAAITRTLEGDLGWTPTAGRPLLGLRVLDMTRVVAAPMATRFLASLGAEVLRIDSPESDEIRLLGVSDVTLGKRWALLDARTGPGLAQLRRLIAGADVMLHGYRPGALDSLGLDHQTRAALRPGLVDVTLNAYGWTGPWSDRRGFDTLVQYSSGIAHEISRWALEQPESRLPLNALGHRVDASRPRHMPVEALDFSAGYQLAAAALMGLVRRAETGAGSLTKMSLARTARLLVDEAVDPGGPLFDLPYEGEQRGNRIHALGNRPTQRIAMPLRIEGTPLFWDRPAELAGSSSPVWSTPDRHAPW